MMTMTVQQIRFYFHRVKRSSVAEIIHRIAEYFFIKRLKGNPNLYKKDLSFDLHAAFNNRLILPKKQSAIAQETISQLLEGKEFTLGTPNKLICQFEKKWQNTFFSNVRYDQSDLDIRAVWEPGRLQHLTALLHYLVDDCEEKDKENVALFVRERVLEWLEKNPFLYGPHYMSAMECGLRVMVFIRALLVLRNLSKDEYETILLATCQHGWLISKRLSLYSSLGNHTVCECLGLVMVGGLFKQIKQGQEWLDTGINLLEQECYHQILSDGGPVEQSFAYHRFVLDLYWLAIHFLTDNGFHDCSAMREHISRGEEFLQTIQQQGESLPMVGDSDDGFAIAPGLSPVRDTPSPVQPSTPFTTFADSGYSLFRGANGLRVLFDHGRLGMEPLNNHGHADCLSIFVSIKDKDFLVDPGTFQYNGDPALRRYFKGTSAHNTVCIDLRDQARQLTGFVWESSFFTVYKHTVDSKGQHTITGKHDGYVLLQKTEVTHSRSLTYNSKGELFIKDFFEGSGTYEYALYFHLHPSVEVKQDGKTLYLLRDTISMVLEIESDKVELLRGQLSPVAGWYSSAYGEKRVTTTIRVVKNGEPNDVVFSTRILVAPKHTKGTSG